MTSRPPRHTPPAYTAALAARVVRREVVQLPRGLVAALLLRAPGESRPPRPASPAASDDNDDVRRARRRRRAAAARSRDGAARISTYRPDDGA